jgi:hypothetical protein
MASTPPEDALAEQAPLAIQSACDTLDTGCGLPLPIGAGLRRQCALVWETAPRAAAN